MSKNREITQEEIEVWHRVIHEGMTDEEEERTHYDFEKRQVLLELARAASLLIVGHRRLPISEKQGDTMLRIRRELIELRQDIEFRAYSGKDKD